MQIFVASDILFDIFEFIVHKSVNAVSKYSKHIENKLHLPKCTNNFPLSLMRTTPYHLNKEPLLYFKFQFILSVFTNKCFTEHKKTAFLGNEDYCCNLSSELILFQQKQIVMNSI